MSVRPVRMEQLGSHWTDFHETWYLSILRKSVENIQICLKSLLYMKVNINLWQYIAECFLE